MKKKLIAAILTGAMLAAGMSTSVWADGEKSFVYGTTGYSEEMGDAGLNPHDNYSGWSALRYGVGETLFKYNDNMEVEPWLATDYEFVDDTTVKITLRDGVQFSSGRTMDAEAVKECLEDLIAVHDRAPYDLKIDHIDADGLTLTIIQQSHVRRSSIILVIHMVRSLTWIMESRVKAVLPMWPELAHILQRTSLQPRSIW